MRREDELGLLGILSWILKDSENRACQTRVKTRVDFINHQTVTVANRSNHWPGKSEQGLRSQGFIVKSEKGPFSVNSSRVAKLHRICCAVDQRSNLFFWDILVHDPEYLCECFSLIDVPSLTPHARSADT
jgi:hypothetical protein